VTHGVTHGTQPGLPLGESVLALKRRLTPLVVQHLCKCCVRWHFRLLRHYLPHCASDASRTRLS
jgi:hypothetical protein